MAEYIKKGAALAPFRGRSLPLTQTTPAFRDSGFILPSEIQASQANVPRLHVRSPVTLEHRRQDTFAIPHGCGYDVPDLDHQFLSNTGCTPSVVDPLPFLREKSQPWMDGGILHNSIRNGQRLLVDISNFLI